jgi:hypothetical protein
MLCENLDCTNEPLQCKDPNLFTVEDCSYSSVSYYCPVLCGKCNSTTTTTQKSSTTSSTLKSCSSTACYNGGKVNSKSCLCDCKIKFKL